MQPSPPLICLRPKHTLGQAPVKLVMTWERLHLPAVRMWRLQNLRIFSLPLMKLLMLFNNAKESTSSVGWGASGILTSKTPMQSLTRLFQVNLRPRYLEDSKQHHTQHPDLYSISFSVGITPRGVERVGLLVKFVADAIMWLFAVTRSPRLRAMCTALLAIGETSCEPTQLEWLGTAI